MDESAKQELDRCKVEVKTTQEYPGGHPGHRRSTGGLLPAGGLLRPRGPGAHPLPGGGDRHHPPGLPPPLPRLLHPQTGGSDQPGLLFRPGGRGLFRGPRRADHPVPSATNACATIWTAPTAKNAARKTPSASCGSCPACAAPWPRTCAPPTRATPRPRATMRSSSATRACSPSPSTASPTSSCTRRCP